MRLWHVAFVLCALLANSALAEGVFPYAGFVVARTAKVRSGPAKVHYETDVLELGTKVEVYRHDPGGWYAVRPPAGSFSWVEARRLGEPDEDQIAQVEENETRVWVGSRVAIVQDRLWQVRLRRGEAVQVLGEKRVRDAETGMTKKWFKIAPPAGEFRWIHRENLGRTPPETTALQTKAHDEVERATYENGEGGSRTSPRNSALTRATEMADGFSAPQKSDKRQSDADRSADSKSADADADASAEKPVAPAESEILTQLRDVEIAFSMMVAREPVHWQLDSLRRRTQALVRESDAMSDRKRARELLARIRDFQQLKDRRDALQENEITPASVARANPGSNDLDFFGAVGTGVRMAGLTTDVDPQFDGVGWLMPLHSFRRGSPSFALVNDDGRLLQYVTPSPGYNLHRYLRMKVGIHGQRGFMRHLNAAHLTAQRVKVLDRGNQ